jgi:SAM-dependent methyltransferase
MNRILRALRRMLHRFDAPPTLASVDAYALWAVNYPPVPHNALMEIEQTAMLALVPSLSGLRVLDLACGTGRYGALAGAQGARLVVGLDSSPDMLRRNSQPAALARMDAIPIADGAFDVVLCGLATGHLPPTAMRAAIREIARVMSVNGTVLISDFHPFRFMSGGRRTFTAPDGKRYAVEHYPHLAADYMAAFQAAGLALDGLLEPTPPDSVIPAVLVLRGTKYTVATA